MKTHPEIPQWLLEQEGLTKRQWKSLKRRQLRDLESALKDFINGCAYTPSFSELSVGKMLYDTKALQGICSIKNWGR